jgi:hypothetical protein
MFEAERIAGTDFEPGRLREYLRPPFRKYEIVTPMSPEDAASVLQKIVQPARIFKWPSFGEHRYFEGKVAGDRFKIRRFINYGNAWLPVIEGGFRRDGSDTIVTVNVRLMWPLVAFQSGIILFLLWTCASIDAHMSGSFDARMLVLGVTLLIYLFSTVSFAHDVRTTMRRLLKLPWSGAASA